MEMDVENVQQQEITIKPIEKSAVHKICSGQVILSLGIAVKELVENAIDAGATVIEVKLKEYGSESIKVCDNGIGVKKENFEALTLKHYTSKIRQFSDLESIQTLGFRGEALSSLCALSELIVLTKTENCINGTKLTYDRNGKIVKEEVAPRETGTTVVLNGLFESLPVRRKEFLKNLKREFGKMCQILNAYCLVSKGIRFTCTNTTNKGSKNTIVATEGFKTVRENIINVFGAKQISDLIDVKQILPNETILENFGLQTCTESDIPFNYEFLISSCIHGAGRSTTDRQFYFINSRPFESTKITKLVNETYKQFNSNQYPFVYLNIFTKGTVVDVNVTPDKRQIFFEREKYLHASLKASLLEVFQTFPSTMKSENTQLFRNLSDSFAITNKKETNKSFKRSFTDTGFKPTFLETFRKKLKSEYNVSKKSIKDNFDEKFNSSKENISGENSKENSRGELHLSESSDEENLEKKFTLDKTVVNFEKISCRYSLKNSENEPEKIISDNDLEKNKLGNDKFEIDKPQITKSVKKSTFLKTSLQEIKEQILMEQQKMECLKTGNESLDISVKFRTEISPENCKKAEEELNKNLSLQDFGKMKIIGQFNSAFLITQLKNDLFIIDQHASDEKYNFEKLQESTVIEHQILVSPKALEITAGNECILMDNVDIFEKNGFKFKIDENAPATKKVSLTSIPLSKNVIFGKDDIDEMLFMLKDSNNTMCRPSRIRAMLASRACRKSVMVGKTLTFKEMQTLVQHMGEIYQPWNCPHGRPTIRHLINMDLLDNG